MFFTTMPSITPGPEAGYQFGHRARIGSRTGGYLYQAGAAFSTAALQLAVIAHSRGRYVTPDLAGGLQYGSTWGNINGDIVDGNLKVGGWCFNFFRHCKKLKSQKLKIKKNNS